MWWPNQDYFDLVTSRDPSDIFSSEYPCKGVLGVLKVFKSQDFSRICTALTNPKICAGIIDIWLNRDYSVYASATNDQNLTLATWEPSALMRMYVRKDVAEQIGNMASSPASKPPQVDPYQGKTITLDANQIIDSTKLSVPMNAPRSLAIAPDGSIYVADLRNDRILHFYRSGTLIKQWGPPAETIPATRILLRRHPHSMSPGARQLDLWLGLCNRYLE